MTKKRHFYFVSCPGTGGQCCYYASTGALVTNDQSELPYENWGLLQHVHQVCHFGISKVMTRLESKSFSGRFSVAKEQTELYVVR